MRLVTILTAVALVAIAITLSIPTQREALATTPTPPAASAGAPGETNCASCHTGNTGNQNVYITAVPPITEYIPGNTYNIAVGFDDAGYLRWGFEATVLKDSDNSMAGTFGTLIDNHVTTVSSGGRTYVCHTTNGATSSGDVNDGTWWGTPDGPVVWAFSWTAPAQGTGDVTFYTSTVSADGSGTQVYDNGYTATMTLPEGAPTPVTSTTWGKIKKKYQ